MARTPVFGSGASLVEQPARPADRADEPIPHVCFLEDLARILRISRRTIEKRRRARVFPIRELPALDSRPRWSGEDVRRYLAHQRTAQAVTRFKKTV